MDGSHHTTWCPDRWKRRCAPGATVDGAGRITVRTVEHGVLRAERRAALRATGGAALRLGWIDGRCQRVEPAAVVRAVADHRDDQQVARARRRDVGQALGLGPVARRFFRVVQQQIARRPAADLQRAQAGVRVDPAAGFGTRELARQVREDRRPGTRAPSPCAPSSSGRRRCPLRGSAPRPPARSRPRCAAPRRSRGTRCRRPLRTCRASSATCSTFASACSPAGRSTSATCARVALSSCCTVSATGM